MKDLDFDFDNSMNNTQFFTCEDCCESWISDSEPFTIKNGLELIEDICPHCGKYITKYI